MEKIYYAGIGSRYVLDPVALVCKRVATILAQDGWVLRSGGATGADEAFETGCDMAHGEKEIFLPWKNFSENSSPLFNISQEAYDYAKKFHPVYSRLTPGAAKLIARDSYQVLGYDLKTPSAIIVYAAEDLGHGEVKGGTGQAIRIANYFNIPTINILNCYKLNIHEIIKLIKGRLKIDV